MNIDKYLHVDRILENVEATRKFVASSGQCHVRDLFPVQHCS